MTTPKAPDVVADDAAMREAADETKLAMAQAAPAPEPDLARLDEVEPGKAVYIVGGVKVGPHGRPIRKDGTEEPPPPGTI